MPEGKNRESASAPPEVPSGIIPTSNRGETRSAALIDLRLCASLLIVVLVVVLVLIGAWPTAEGAVGLSPLAAPVVLSLVGLSRRSSIRITRFRRG